VSKDKRKGGRGRVTPKGGPRPDVPPPEQRSFAPKRIGPFDKPDPDAPLGQVGRRPSSPGRLFVFAGVWFVCGVLAFVVLTGALRFVIGFVLVGISLLWLRGAATAYLRQHRGEGQG